MANLVAPHEVTDTERLNNMVNTLSNGGSLPAVLTHEGQAYSGPHRIEVWKTEGLEPTITEQFLAVCQELNIDSEYEVVTDFEAA